MDNYLNHRWPLGPGVQPPPVPSSAGSQPQEKKKRSPRRWVVPLVSILLCVAILGGICFWAVSSIADIVAQVNPSLPDDPRPWITRPIHTDPGWSPEDLPWGDPDPAVALSGQSSGTTATGRQIYQNVLPSLVRVEAAHASRFDGASVGTGVVVTDTGYVVTNYHIIDETVSIQVSLLDGANRYFDAKVIGFDEEFDLAVLKFDPEDVPITPAALGDSDQLAVGDWVYAVGNPMGYLLGSMSGGLVSALNRDEDAYGSALGLIQLDMALNPGNSGGALVNEAGQVVGITCAKITGIERENGESIENSVVLEGMGLAIPITDAIPFINHMLATGKTWRPAMGITCSAAAVGGRQGIQVAEVTGDAAKEAGLQRNDLILSANDAPVTSLVELRRVLYRTGAGEMLHCTVLRDGEEIEISFPLLDSLEQD